MRSAEKLVPVSATRPTSGGLGARFTMRPRASNRSSRVTSAIKQLMDDLPSSILAQENSNAMISSETRWFIIWALIGLALLALGGMFAFHFLRRAQLRVTETYTFPMIKVPERFDDYAEVSQADPQKVKEIAEKMQEILG